ncbi:receptor expression enhancing protein 3 [Rhizophagus irregularis]|uniref:Protein YOP1 n=3 Tax=Rhizophagus irregularis TaxID=588596 RepID=A0A2I1FVA9_9GLOM|nr:receptor expression enhancing protein 3 [Rhizophagus irregularis DAOM 181602=DAOM 197198]EXX63046.1 Yop1p [Rhizophagus irregularis DAOM 197198w]PKC17323.1 receptor expression enhancing protein 3 [Rhizophagus irregularis]PKC71174.1 receptor expression enhancing protein 3 [Rhizophagus irregularis]PKK77356.1 receptor expression enhancing protein 3 [Rhizophagus irregularis]PKY13654.1 receptor expression enhancing protein 3 [Rhizophagus irregularis]|eukprot:XP_025164769.1 receptor expression enhancing protein 3 [Rhizophagus irregularis DAOM 181602=DAOM 197198]
MFGYLLYKIVCNLAGFLYPAYASFKAIKANDTKIILPWLIYWIVMAFFTLGEGIADSLIFWFPFYYEMKILFILWLILPQTRGAAYLYDNYIDPTLTFHQKEIDSTLGMAQEKATSTGVEWGRHGLATLQELGQQIIKGRTSF